MFGRATIRLDIGPHSSFQWSTQDFILRDINFTTRSELRKVMFLALSVTFLFVYEISQEPLNGFAPNSHGRRDWSTSRTSLKVKVKGR